MITITTKVQFGRGRAGRKRMRIGQQPAAPAGRVPRISKLMALAIRFDGLVRDGKVGDFSELARLARVTQPRMTQIINLTHLAPDIQEQLLFLPLVTDGKDPIHERMLRPVCAQIDWRKQRIGWTSIRGLALPSVTAMRSDGSGKRAAR